MVGNILYIHQETGGVAVDIGSGFDLLAGKISRPVHRRVLGEAGKAYL